MKQKIKIGDHRIDNCIIMKIQKQIQGHHLKHLISMLIFIHMTLGYIG